MNIQITKKAIKELKSLVASKEESSKNKIRIYISGIGWGGPSFGIALDEHKKNDVTYSTEGLDFIAEDDIFKKYNQFKIDYVSNWFRKGFLVYADGGSSC